MKQNQNNTLSSHNKPTQQQFRNNNLLIAQQPRSRKRKLSNMFQRILQPNSLSKQKKKEQINVKQTSKFKCQRKDTKQTDPSFSHSNIKNQQNAKNQQLQEMIKKSEDDPFVRRKLKKIVQNDVKNLVKVTNPKSLVESMVHNSSFDNLKTEDLLSFALYLQKTNKKDDSKISNSSFILSKNVSNTSKDMSLRSINSTTPINERILKDFSQIQSQIIDKNKIIHFNNQYTTTLRKENFRKNIERLNQLKNFNQKEQVFTPQQNYSFVQKNTSIQSYKPQLKNKLSNPSVKSQKQINSFCENLQKLNIIGKK